MYFNYAHRLMVRRRIVMPAVNDEDGVSLASEDVSVNLLAAIATAVQSDVPADQIVDHGKREMRTVKNDIRSGRDCDGHQP